MTYKEYMFSHQDENMHFCKPYTNDDEDRFLIMYDGEADAIVAPGIEAHRWNGLLRIYMEQFTRELVGEDYDLHHGYTDEEIALHYMHEIGCASCPFFHVCEAMNEEMEDA